MWDNFHLRQSRAFNSVFQRNYWRKNGFVTSWFLQRYKVGSLRQLSWKSKYFQTETARVTVSNVNARRVLIDLLFSKYIEEGTFTESLKITIKPLCSLLCMVCPILKNWTDFEFWQNSRSITYIVCLLEWMAISPIQNK